MSAVGDNFPCEKCKNNKDDDCALYFDCPLLVDYYMCERKKL